MLEEAVAALEDVLAEDTLMLVDVNGDAALVVLIPVLALLDELTVDDDDEEAIEDPLVLDELGVLLVALLDEVDDAADELVDPLDELEMLVALDSPAEELDDVVVMLVVIAGCPIDELVVDEELETGVELVAGVLGLDDVLEIEAALLVVLDDSTLGLELELLVPTIELEVDDDAANDDDDMLVKLVLEVEELVDCELATAVLTAALLVDELVGAAIDELEELVLTAELVPDVEALDDVLDEVEVLET